MHIHFEALFAFRNEGAARPVGRLVRYAYSSWRARGPGVGAVAPLLIHVASTLDEAGKKWQSLVADNWEKTSALLLAGVFSLRY